MINEFYVNRSRMALKKPGDSLSSDASMIMMVLSSVIIWIAVFFRFTAVFYALVAVAIAAVYRRLSSRSFHRFLLIGFVFFSLLPIDISFRTTPAPPHFARVINTVGDPLLGFRTDREGALQRLHRGEFVLLSNCTGAYQPIWILVW